MKKTIFILALSLLGTQPVWSQVSVRFELGTNLNQTKMSYPDTILVNGLKLKGKLGYQGGVRLHARIVAGLSVEAGAFYKNIRYNYDYMNYYAGSHIYGSYSINYLNIPVSLEYNYDLKEIGSVFAGAGGYWASALSGKYSLPDPYTGSVTKDLQFGDKRGDFFTQTDMGILFYVGYKTPIGIYFRLQYDKGLKNISPEGNLYGSNLQTATYKNGAFAFSIGYQLNIWDRR